MLIILTVIVVSVCCMILRIPERQFYYQFADRRSLLGIPNFGDVVSHLPFTVIGIWGVASRTKQDSAERKNAVFDKQASAYAGEPVISHLH
jgi:hypothetical protein